MAYATSDKRKAYQNAWSKRKRADRNRSWNKWADKNREKVNAKSQRYRKAHSDKVRVAKRIWHLKTFFGLTLEQYDAMLIAQNGVCAVCRQPELTKRRGVRRSLAIDHNHATGQIRALLCTACNSSLGRLQEDPLRIRALADYVERYA